MQGESRIDRARTQGRRPIRVECLTAFVNPHWRRKHSRDSIVTMRTRSLIPMAMLLCGCVLRRGQSAPEPPRGPARDSLLSFDASRSDSIAARGVVDGTLSVLSADAVLLRAGVPAVYGRVAVRSVLSARNAPTGLVSWAPLGGGVSDDLLSGYTYGVTARSANGTPRLRLERYVAYWERARARPWRVVAYAEVDGPTTPLNEVTLAPADTAPPLRPLSKPLAEARAAVRAADSSFADLAYRMGTGYAFSNTVAETGVLFGNPALLVGPDAVREFYQLRGDSSSLTWKPVFAAVAGSRDLGYTVGEYISTGRGPSGAAVQRFGKYLTVWKRQKDGTWRFVVDGGNGTR
jgi:ketosteroid isomerase-like protein